jgi:hypothetical protein
MTLATPPDTPNLIRPDAPFLLTAFWAWDGPGLKIAACVYPGAPLHEYLIRDHLAEQVARVDYGELPIVLTIRKRRDGWAFDYLGGPEWFASRLPSAEPPQLRTPAELSEGEEAMLRESLGIPPTAPIPQPQGPLPPSERPEEPFRFDPTPHMDLSTADAPAEIPPPAPPGPEPAPGAETSPVPRIPPPVKKGLGSFGDRSHPFPH